MGAGRRQVIVESILARPGQEIMHGHRSRFGSIGATKHRHDVLDRYDKEVVVTFEIDGNRVLGVKQHFVVLPERDVFIVFYRGRDGDDSTSDGRNFRIVRQSDPTFGLSFGLVFADQNAVADRLDVFKRGTGHRR